MLVGRVQNNWRMLVSRTPYFWSLLIAYTAAHGIILLTLNAVFWDDWTLVPATRSEILETFSQNGSFLNISGYIHVVLLSLGPWAYHVTTLFIFFYSALILNIILIRNYSLSKDVRFLVLLFFLISPLYMARVSLIVMPYTISFFCFMLAWRLIPHYRILSLLLFAISFNTQSLLVFFALPITEWYIRTVGQFSIKSTARWILHRLDFIFLPFLWFYLKLQFFAPSGYYENYNSTYRISGIPKVAKDQLIDMSQQRPDVGLFLILFFVFFIFFHKNAHIFRQNRHAWIFLVTGCLMLILGLFPYWILGLLPKFDDWGSRHQLLMPFGISFMAAGLVMAFPPRLAHFIATTLAALFLAQSIETSWGVFKDSRKQEQILSYLQLSEDIRSSDLIVVNDTTPNAFSRNYRFYEWNGMMRHIYGDQTRFGVLSIELKTYSAGRYDRFFHELYNAAEHVRRPSNKQSTFTIHPDPTGIQMYTSQSSAMD